VLLKKIIRAKPQNDPDKLDAYRCELYNKLEIDIQRLTKKQFEKLPGMKPFGFVYNNLDTVSESVPYLPFFLTESLADYYYRSDPKKTREVVKASLVKGIRSEGISQFLGGLYIKLNSYKNRIPVFDKNFVSPVSDNAAMYYKYKIKDTQSVHGHQVFLVQYAPKRAGENCFYGDFWVADSSWALQRISLEMPKDANINWVTRLSLFQEFVPVGDTMWTVAKDKFVVDFNIPYANKKMPGFIGRKTTTYRNMVPGAGAADSGLNDPRYRRDVVVTDTARKVSEAAWAAARPELLSHNEQAIYHMIDTLQQMPLFVRTKNWVKFLATGKKDIGLFEIGPIWSMYSSNPVEGRRFRFSANTTDKLFRDIQLGGYLAYGTKDEEFKYKANVLWISEREPRTSVYASYTHDVDRSNNYYDESRNTDNLFANMFRKRHIPWRLAFADETRVEWQKEYYSGFSHKVTAVHRDFTPYAPLPSYDIFADADGHATNTVSSTEIGLSLRYAHKEKFIEGKFKRKSLGSKYPIPEIRYVHGISGALGGNYNYDKLSFVLSDKLRLGALGKAKYTLFAGKVLGTLPYALLEIHPGNDFHFYNPRAFNMMRRYEFISDEYAGFMWEHDIGGGIFNYIPGVRKAKLRQFWTAKGVMGCLTDDNKKLNLEKGYPFKTLENKPYIEVGTGVENIFQLFRIDFVWRVAPAPLPHEERDRHFGIFGSMKLSF
jgi:hypothetical protein